LTSLNVQVRATKNNVDGTIIRHTSSTSLLLDVDNCYEDNEEECRHIPLVPFDSELPGDDDCQRVNSTRHARSRSRCVPPCYHGDEHEQHVSHGSRTFGCVPPELHDGDDDSKCSISDEQFEARVDDFNKLFDLSHA